ncbi:hypothetical protein [Marinitoga lauensis]|uniref:hypothetical protein n=1 Tax=Marinitoga lauensis TaxID=2201189 RepID=UPI00101155E9|nr:hypothetical protein [Marinitoga lauensis]
MKKRLVVVIILLVAFFVTVFSIFSSKGTNAIKYKKIEYNSLTYYDENTHIVYLNKGNFTVDDNGILYYVVPAFNITKNKHQILVSKLNVLSKKITYDFLNEKIFEKTNDYGIVSGALTIDNGILYYKGIKGIWSIKNEKINFYPFSENILINYANGDFVHTDDGFWIISEVVYRVGSKYNLYKYSKENGKLVVKNKIETEENILNITKYNNEVYIFCHNADNGKFNLYKIKNDSLEKVYTIYGNRFQSTGYYTIANSSKKYYFYSVKFISIIDNKIYLKGMLKNSDEYNLIEINLNTGKENYYDLYPNYQLDYAADIQYTMKKIKGKYYLFIKSKDDDPDNLKIFSIIKR